MHCHTNYVGDTASCWTSWNMFQLYSSKHILGPGHFVASSRGVSLVVSIASCFVGSSVWGYYECPLVRQLCSAEADLMSIKYLRVGDRQ